VGYWQNMEQTQAAFRGDWFASSDMIVQDEDGIFRYCGRGDDMLKVSGKWLSPGEVENCLLQHPAVEEVAVVGVTDSAGLTKPFAFITAAGEAPEPGELQDWVKARLAPHKYPRRVVLMDSLPRTHLGKVDRGQLKRYPE
jgi:benzoate-CoA ligase